MHYLHINKTGVKRPRKNLFNNMGNKIHYNIVIKNLLKQNHKM